GRYTFVFKSFTQIPVPGMAKGKAVNVVQPSTAVLVMVLPKQVASLTVANPSPTVKAGEEVEVTVKVARQHDFADSFRVKLVLPREARGLSAEEGTLPPSQNEVKLIIRAAEDATPGPRNNLTVQATALLQGVTLTHETKINMTVAK